MNAKADPKSFFEMRLEPIIKSKLLVNRPREPNSCFANSIDDTSYFFKSLLRKRLNSVAYKSKFIASIKKSLTYDKSKTMLSPFTSIVMVSG
jgi:hypothetical protein